MRASGVQSGEGRLPAVQDDERCGLRINKSPALTSLANDCGVSSPGTALAVDFITRRPRRMINFRRNVRSGGGSVMKKLRKCGSRERWEGSTPSAYR